MNSAITKLPETDNRILNSRLQHGKIVIPQLVGLIMSTDTNTKTRKSVKRSASLDLL